MEFPGSIAFHSDTWPSLTQGQCRGLVSALHQPHETLVYFIRCCRNVRSHKFQARAPSNTSNISFHLSDDSPLLAKFQCKVSREILTMKVTIIGDSSRKQYGSSDEEVAFVSTKKDNGGVTACVSTSSDDADTMQQTSYPDVKARDVLLDLDIEQFRTCANVNRRLINFAVEFCAKRTIIR